jgi:phospholipid/cholesterol/gamma-HCH transport system substrate-binding protein
MNSEAKVGLTAILGLSLLIAIVLYLSGVNFGTGGYRVNAVFSHVNGLKTGNTVNYSGVYIGTVSAIIITSQGIQVEMLIDSDVKIPQGSKFTINSDGLLGEQHINVIPNRAALENKLYMVANDLTYGQSPVGIDTVMDMSSETMEEIRKAVVSLNEIIGDKNVQTSMKETVVNLDKLTAALSQMALNNQDKINATVLNLALMSESMRSLAARFDSMSATFDNDGQTAAELRELVVNLNNSSRSLEKMMTSMEGVVADPKTAEDLKTIIGNTKAVSEKANKIMNKTSLKTSTNLEMLYDFKDDKYTSNAMVKIGSDSSKSFGVIGVSDIGDENRFNLQYGRDVSRWTERMGIIEGKLGLGADARIGSKLKISLDVYDPNDVKYKVRAQYKIMPDLSLIGQTDRDKDRPDSQHNYFGLQRTF